MSILTAAWSPTRGCSKVSPGCDNCSSERMAWRNSRGAYRGLVGLGPSGKPEWTGDVRAVAERMEDPISWAKPRRVLVSNTSDLFHERLPDNDIAEVFAVMAIASQHTFQVLTKRAERMRDLLCDASFMVMVAEKVRARDYHGRAARMEWPLDNVWMGVSVENDVYARERMPLLTTTPAKVRFVSAEPLLEAIDLTPWLVDLRGFHERCHLVIGGGESGPGSRPFHLEWMESLQQQCATTGTFFFAKQLGANAYYGGVRYRTKHSHGGDPMEWPEALRVRELPDDGLAVVGRGK